MDGKYSFIAKKSSLSTPARRWKIVHVVAAVHVAVIFLPLAYFLVVDYWKDLRKKDVVVVRLVEVPKEVTQKTVKKPARRRSKPKKRVVRKKQPKKKTVQKKVAEPKIAKPAKPVRKVQKNTVSQNAKPVARKVQPKPKYQPPVHDDLEIIRPEDLKRVPEEQEEEDENDDEVGATYTEQLVGVFYKLWNPPSSQLLNGRTPRVYIKVKFNRYGKVLKAEITKKSGFLPMDRSVAELLRNLSQVPAPPPGEPTEIEFVLVPQE